MVTYISSISKHMALFLILNFHRALNVVFFLFSNFPASEFNVPTFRNTLFHLRRWFKQEHHLWRWNRIFRNIGT